MLPLASSFTTNPRNTITVHDPAKPFTPMAPTSLETLDAVQSFDEKSNGENWAKANKELAEVNIALARLQQADNGATDLNPATGVVVTSSKPNEYTTTDEVLRQNEFGQTAVETRTLKDGGESWTRVTREMEQDGDHITLAVREEDYWLSRDCKNGHRPHTKDTLYHINGANGTITIES